MNPGFFALPEEGEVPFKTPKRWSGNVGSVLIARTDRKPLWPHHLRTLMRYMREIYNIARLFIPYDARGPLAVRMLVAGKTSPTAEDILSHITPGEFKEYYMAQCQLKMKLRYPTPWSWTSTDQAVLNRVRMQWNYYWSSLDEKFRAVETWKERVLLHQIRVLQGQLDESEKLGAIERKRSRSGSTIDDEAEQGPKRRRLGEDEKLEPLERKRRRSPTASDEGIDHEEKRTWTMASIGQVTTGHGLV